ncbi:phage tail protein [Oricola thermophila]|uniref:Tip attachment protein J domain-containing protein n=1 Tax=Oricola thermophila TaxID=2742145 RepID=A0A6N1VF55_9HYPH|nr:phage tail protein [Oricola thermophila]QKV17862.1 hypothetical protein HTY61_05005 [Oricola thermophila]
MPIISAIAGAVGAVAGAIGTAVGAVGSFVAGLGAIGKAVLSIGLNLAISALFKPKEAKPVSGVELDVQYGADQSRTVRCGRWGIAGHYVYANTMGAANKYFQQVYAVSDFYCTSLDRVWIDGEEVTLGAVEGGRGNVVDSGEYAGKIWVKFIDGRQTTADSYLVNGSDPAGRWTSDHVGLGVAYIIVTLEYDREKLGNVVNFFFEGKGAPLYDWRKDSTMGGSGNHRWDDPSTWEFSENPVLMDYAYRRGFKINGDLFCGMDEDANNLPIERYTIAANICDEVVEDGGPRYRCAIGFDCNAEHGDNIDALMTSCGGMVVHAVDGVWPIIGTDQTPVATLTDDDLIVGERVQFQRLRPASELVNSVSGTFPDPDNQWSPVSYERATDVIIVATDRRSKDVSMNFGTVPYARQAAQLASIYFSENRFEATATITVRPRWQVLEPGDWIVWESEKYGTRTYLVTDTSLVTLQSDKPRCVVLQLQERSGDIYTSVGTVAPPPVPLGPATPAYQSELLDFSVTGVTGAGNDGRLYPAIRAGWTAVYDPTITAITLEYRAKDHPDVVFERTVQSNATVAYLAEGVLSDTVYEVRYFFETDPTRSVTPSAWVEVTTPDVPTGDVSVGLGQVKDDISDLLKRHSTLLDELARNVELIAADTAIGAGRLVEQTAVVKRTDRSLAAAIQTLEATATETEANAQAITQVQANVDNLAAGGLIKFEANAGQGSVLVTIDILARATINDQFAQSGLSIRVSDDGNGGFIRDVVIDTGRFVVTDGTNDALPLVFENGELVSEIARFREAIAEGFETPSGKARFGILAPNVEGVEITT